MRITLDLSETFAAELLISDQELLYCSQLYFLQFLSLHLKASSQFLDRIKKEEMVESFLLSEVFNLVLNGFSLSVADHT